MLKIIGIYLLIINVVTFVLYGIDKWKAIHNKWRIREATLLITALIGGSLGAFVAMQMFRHKTKKWYFKLYGSCYACCACRFDGFIGG
ncbi:MAG: DUF1294 domain-containing protein [Lachnospira eligens]